MNDVFMWTKFIKQWDKVQEPTFYDFMEWQRHEYAKFPPTAIGSPNRPKGYKGYFDDLKFED